MRAFTLICVCLLLAVTASFCGKKETPEEKARKEAAQKMEQLAQAMKSSRSSGGNQTGNAFAEMQKSMEAIKKQSETQQGGSIVVADKETLLSVLPDVGGWTRAEPRYSRNAMGGMELSELSARYTQGEESVSAKITDSGTMSSVLTPLKMLLQLNINREDENGMEKVSNVNGIPVIEKFHKNSNRGEITLICKDRYIINLEMKGENSIKVLEDFCSKINFSALK